ncbi:MAG: DUF2284 domain-containing protein, partial [Treponema sp.]|nr:DUF2284 domain-containing protein [Treponema sp.]
MEDVVKAAWKLAEESGFSHIGELDVSKIQLRVEVRDACAVNKCGQYGKSWSCPPGCGTFEECEVKLRQYHRGLLLQSTGEMEDPFDVDVMTSTADDHAERFKLFKKSIENQYKGVFFIGGVCRNCEKCTYPDAPCRFPDQISYSLEGLGMIVS